MTGKRKRPTFRKRGYGRSLAPITLTPRRQAERERAFADLFSFLVRKAG